MKALFTMRKSTSILTRLQTRLGNVGLRSLSFCMSAVLVFNVFATPAFAAGWERAKEQSKKEKEHAPERMSVAVDNTIDIIDAFEHRTLNDEEKKRYADALSEYRQQIVSEAANIEQLMRESRQEITDKQLAPVFVERQMKMAETYEQRHRELLEKIDELIEENSGNILEQGFYTLKNLLKHTGAKTPDFKAYKNEKQQRFDPDTLKKDPLEPSKTNQPKRSKEAYLRAGLGDHPMQYYAALGDFKYDTLPEATNPLYLSENDEVVLSDAIKAKAAELDYDPVKIYNYVHNTIEFVPTWGAVQNADLTLGAKRGNAIDTAALTIALLRASKIPARFVHGTVNVPAEKFNNWLGGFTSTAAAANYAGKGGIPLNTMSEGGKIKSILMEHVWVEAALDYYPSRGAKNLVADRWSQFDPSFKQHIFHEGADLLNIAGLDVNATLESFLSSGTLNESESWVKDFNTSVIQDALNSGFANIDTYINENNSTLNSLYDVIGGQQIIAQNLNIIPSSLPMEVVTEGARYDKVPSALQQKMSIQIEGYSQESVLDEFYNGKKVVTLPLSKLNNEKLTLSFAPATAADEAAIESFIPDANSTTAVELPTYIHVKPQLKLNGTVIMEMVETRLGEEFGVIQTLHRPSGDVPFHQPRMAISGGYYSINTVAQSVSVEKINALQNRLEQTRGIIESGDTAQLALLSREEVMGDLMYAGSLNYYAQHIAKSDRIIQMLDSRSNLVSSSGLFGYKPDVVKLYSMPIKLRSGGVIVDLVDVDMTEAKDMDAERRKQANIQKGMIGSALEHEIPEQMFITDANPTAQGFSVMKALQLANEQGQKIFQITSANVDVIAPQLQLAQAAKDDIVAAAKAGLTVVTHERRISVPGYTGEGYIILNEDGTGLYMINGGMYGGYFTDPQAAALSLTLFVGALALGPVIALSVHIIIVAVSAALILDGYLDIANHNYGSPECNAAAQKLALMYSLVALFSGVLGVQGIEKLRFFIIETVALSVFANLSHTGLKLQCR